MNKKKFFYILLMALAFASCNSKPLELNVMSFNIRYDNPEDSLNNWQYRKEIAAQTIQDQNTDVVGIQEALVNQLNDFKWLLSDYNSIGVGREDGVEKGEYSAILYQRERFKEIKSGYFWLSETPDRAGSRGWDGACERIATWAIFMEKKTKKQFFFINTHLDHVGKQARREGVNLLLSQTKRLSEGLPVIITGDFNASPESEVIQPIIESDEWMHTRDIAESKEGPQWTFHGFGRVPEEKREFIDYVFVSKGIKTMEHKVLPAKQNDRYISDHSVVYTRLKIR
ncbi:MAG: endonuclease/exonuclease/phosphatase family protein [Candidatus Azobacteroides sp.]|nr:endonuclease/exonuclease/phosphatase family protein [Candidatus Azobacteroides sp.]